MKEKVMLLAQGKFAYEQPEIILSTEKLEFEVPEGGEAQAVFHVKNELNKKMKGFCAVDEFDIEFLPVFDGKDNEITVKAHAGTRRHGDVMSGDIYILTDCGEKVLPYCITVTGRYLEAPSGTISSYEEFVRLAEDDFGDAVQFFYKDKFKKMYLHELSEKRLYQYLTQKNSKKQALEEFLIAHGDKKSLQFAVNKKQIILEIEEDDITDEVIVVKDCWGLVGIHISSDCSFLSVDKEVLDVNDFTNNQAVVPFHISASDVTPGRHHCHLIFESVYQTVDVSVRIHCMKGAEERRVMQARKKLAAGLVRCHIQHMMNSSLRESWYKMLEENRQGLFSLCYKYEPQMTGYMSYLAGDAAGMNFFRSATEDMEEPKPRDETDKVYRYLLSVFLRAKMSGSEQEKEAAERQIRQFYTNGYRHWKLLVLLERLGVYADNQESFLEELDLLWEDGCRSPYMHMYRMLLILQDVDLLSKLDSRTIGALRFGVRHGLMTEDIVMALSFLASRERRCTPVLLNLLEKCYDMFALQDTLNSICTLLIRSEKQESRYFKWFQLGVENSLRITDLFEYYMYSMDKSRFDEALSTVISYFKYENHLRDSVKASFYASIVRNRNEHPEYFQVYQDVIWKFVEGQLSNHRINSELTVLYEAFLTQENVKGQIAKDLPYVLFTHHITCKNKNMERVVVVHDEGGGEMKYNLVGGEADINIGTPHYMLYFEDKNGYYHAKTVKYKLDKMLNLDLLAARCYENGSEHPVLLLNLFFQALEKEEISAPDAIILHMLIRSGLSGVEYRSKALIALYEYYRSIGEDSLLEEILKEIDFQYLDEEKRAGVLQTMIQHRMNDEALERLRKYRIMNASPKLILLLVTWKLEENEGRFDPYHMRLCDYLYRNGASNAATLSYLTNYYMGATGHLRDIYRDAKKSAADIGDGGTERLLGQALFISADPEQYADIFLDYYDYGANRTLAKAFLSYTAYEYIVGKCGLAEGIVSKVRKEGLSEEHQTMILAMLKYYSGKEEYTDSEREYIVYHLSRYVSMGKIMDFMKAFEGKVEMPFELENSGIVQFYCSNKKDVYIEVSDENGEKVTQPMKRVFTDVYVYETILFQGERLNYRIFAGNMDEPVKEGILEVEKTDEVQEMAFYQIVNEMINAQERGDKTEFDALADKYKCRHKIADELFTPL